MSENVDDIIVRDHTRLRDRPRRLWTFGGFSLPGLNLAPLGAFGAGFIVSFLLSLVVLFIPGLSGLMLILFIVDIVVGIAVSLWWSRFSTDDLKPSQWLLIQYDYRIRQPKRISGLGADSEPDSVSLFAVMWEPNSQWRTEVDRLRAAYLHEDSRAEATGT